MIKDKNGIILNINDYIDVCDFDERFKFLKVKAINTTTGIIMGKVMHNNGDYYAVNVEYHQFQILTTQEQIIERLLSL